MNSFGRYDLPECEELGVETFRYAYHSSMLVEDFICVVLVGPQGMNMGEEE